jgi:maltose O-acetyltransferase
MLDHKLKLMKALHSFNDTSIPDNSTYQSFRARQMALIEQMMGKFGKGINVEAPFFCIWGCNIFLGDGVYMNREYVLPHPSLFKV